MSPSRPRHYDDVKQRHPSFIEAIEKLGAATHKEGPLDSSTAQLVQLAAAAATRSEGAVHSHVKRALEAGLEPTAIQHALILLTTTIGFPAVMAALSWADDIFKEVHDDKS